ncbi:MAG: hypothetical protein HZA79_04975 [Sphingobacteriales bacterium]|nr:hypothetical protein [Sphingobacteriales bacterium]
MRQFLLVAAFLLTAFFTSAQQIDSLKELLKNTRLPDTQRIDALNTLCRELTFIDPIEGAKAANEALKASLQINYLKGQAYGYRGLSSIFSNSNQTIIAAEYLRRALDIYQRLNDSAGIANCYITLGHAMRKAQDHPQEIKYHQLAFEIFSRLKMNDRIAVTAHNLGESCLISGEVKKSRELTEYAIHILTDSAMNLAILSNCYKVMGKLELLEAHYDSARDYFEKVLAISAALGPNSQKIATAESMIELAGIYKQKGQLALQQSALISAAGFCERNNLSNYLRVIYSQLVLLNQGNPGRQIGFVKEYMRASDSAGIRSIRNQTDLEQYGIEVFRYLEAEARKSEKKYILQEQKIKSKNQLLGTSLIVALVFFILILLLTRSIRKHRKAEEEIREMSEQLRELAANLQNIREEERIRIARDIHEELGQQLSAIKMNVSWFREHAGDQLQVAEARADETIQLLEQSILAVRDIAASLRPGTLDDIGLDVAIRWQLAESEKRYHFKTAYKSAEKYLQLPETVNTGLFRICQEALHIAGQFSMATYVTVTLSRNKRELVLQVEDNGPGPGTAELKSASNIGLLEMKERCYMIQGTLDIKRLPGKGSLLTIRVPVEEKE